VFRVQDTRTDRVIERLRYVLPQSSDAIADGAIVVVEDAQHRVRPRAIVARSEQRQCSLTLSSRP
jgi:hypothetical protein